MKKIILILLLVAVSVGGYAQKKRVESTIMRRDMFPLSGAISIYRVRLPVV